MTGQTGHAAGRGQTVTAAVAAVLAAVLLSAVGVAALDLRTAAADTVLLRGADATVVLVDGTERPLREGDEVPRGATVRAGTTGAVLETRGREVWLGQATTVTVLDGARQELGAGFVMVDADEGPGLELTTAASVVTTDDGSLVRVVAGPLERVGVLRGDAATVRAAGRRASTEVPTYYQAQVSAGGLPTMATPLLLTGDAYERELARDLFDADRDLNALARRLDMRGEAGPAVLQVLSTVVPAAAPVPGAPESERALGFLLAAADDPDRAPASYDRVRALRTAGGSWGVVAAIVGVSANDVSGVLAALLEPGVPALAAGGSAMDADLLVDLLGGAAPGAPGAVDEPAPGPAPSPRPSPPPGGPGPGPGPSPSPTPGPVPPPPATGVPLVDEVVDTVLDLVDPTPSPLLPVDVPLDLPGDDGLVDVGVLDRPLLDLG